MKLNGSQSILLIEDDDTIREVIQEALQIEGYHVRTAINGREALALIQNGLEPSLILLDLMLPVMSGWEFLDILRRHSNPAISKLPVIIMSAAGNAALTAVEKAQGYVQKPLDLEILFKEVEKFFERSL